ncbi:hypothetical protein F2S72_09710 [Pseudomonas syringae pv. actinidiae]|nr:hypothetical protein [Pseudomonas syringae pv. actinidiae]
MSFKLRAASGLLIALSLSLQGCATKNPDWLVNPTGAYCATRLTDPCLKAFAEKAYSDVTARHVVAQNAAQTHVAEAETKPVADKAETQETGSGASKPGLDKPDAHEEAVEPRPTSPIVENALPASTEGMVASQADSDQRLEPDVKSKGDAHHASGKDGIDSAPAPGSGSAPAAIVIPDGPIPKLAFGIAAIGATPTEAAGYQPTPKVMESKQAGAILNISGGQIPDTQLEEAGKIVDKELRADALAGLLSLHSRSMTDNQINKVLNDLYALDQHQYAEALIIKLPGLLRAGDLERAKALRGVLLTSEPEQDRPFSMLAFVASCYTMAGMTQDAGDIVRDSFEDGSQLSPDDKRLISLAISVSNGSYPMMQEFYDFKSDEARLSAYLNIAVIARQLGNPEVAHKAVADAVRFIQKSAVKVDRVKALGQILAVSPGVI